MSGEEEPSVGEHLFRHCCRCLALKRRDASRFSPAALLLLRAVEAYHMDESQEDFKAGLATMLELARRQEGDEEKGLSVGDIHFVVGKCYEEGIGIQKNKPEAVHHYTQGALHRHAISQCLLGLMYELGRGVPSDKREALRLYLQSASQGNPAAQNNVGLLYERGVPGVAEQDYAKAATYYILATQQQIPGSKYSLGNLYTEGKIVDEIELPPFPPTLVGPTTTTTTSTTTTSMETCDIPNNVERDEKQRKKLWRIGIELKHAAALGGNKKGMMWLSTEYSQQYGQVVPADAAKASQFESLAQYL